MLYIIDSNFYFLINWAALNASTLLLLICLKHFVNLPHVNKLITFTNSSENRFKSFLLDIFDLNE